VQAGPIAVTRVPSRSIAHCEVTYVQRSPIDPDLARAQHRAYVDTLRDHGLTIIELPAEDALPDAVFVEDPVIVLDEVAVALHMGAPSRRPEVDSLVHAITPFRSVVRMDEHGTVDGGDVLRIGRTLYVGLSTRTDAAGLHALADVVGTCGHTVCPVRVHGCLHLKSACTWLGDRLLMNPDWIDTAPFADLPRLRVAEPWAADVLGLPDPAATGAPARIVMPASFPRTRDMLRHNGYDVRAVDVSELQKAEAGVTCMALVFAGSGNGATATATAGVTDTDMAG